MADKKIGEVIHFYEKIQVAIVRLSAPLKVGDTIKFVHGDTESTQTVTSMEMEHGKIENADKGMEIGLKVDQPVKKNSLVFLA